MADLFHRISVRKFQPKPVENEKIDQILKAAMQAPSTGNQQPWEFYVVTNPEKLKELGTASRFATPAAEAPVSIVTAYRMDCRMPDWAQIDLSIAMENMWLMTDELGLGGVWLGIAPVEPRMKTVENIVGMPEGIRAFGIFAFGYPAEDRPQEDRYKPERIHYLN